MRGVFRRSLVAGLIALPFVNAACGESDDPGRGGEKRDAAGGTKADASGGGSGARGGASGLGGSLGAAGDASGGSLGSDASAGSAGTSASGGTLGDASAGSAGANGSGGAVSDAALDGREAGTDGSRPRTVIDDCPGPLDPGLAGALQGGGASNPNLRWLYPYDRAVFPRGLPAPVLQWNPAGSGENAIYVHLRSTKFEYKGCF